MQQGATIYSSHCKQAIEMTLLRLGTQQLHYPVFSLKFCSDLTHLGPLYPIIYIIGNEKTHRGHPGQLERC